MNLYSTGNNRPVPVMTISEWADVMTTAFFLIIGGGLLVLFLFVTHLFIISIIIGVILTIGGFGFALHAKNTRDNQPATICEQMRANIGMQHLWVTDIYNNNISICDQFLEDVDSNLSLLSEDEEKTKAEIAKLIKKLVNLKEDTEKIKHQLDDIWDFSPNKELGLTELWQECQAKVAEYGRKSKNLENKTAELRATYRQADSILRKALGQQSQNYDELFYWEEMPGVPSTIIEVPQLSTRKNIYLGILAGIAGVAIVIIANLLHATQLPEVAIVRGKDGLFSYEYQEKPSKDGIYEFSSDTFSIKICILNERGFGDGTDANMSFSGGRISQTTDDSDKKKGRACWTAKAKDDYSKITAGEHTVTVRNNAGEVNLKIRVEEPSQTE